MVRLGGGGGNAIKFYLKNKMINRLLKTMLLQICVVEGEWKKGGGKCHTGFYSDFIARIIIEFH